MPQHMQAILHEFISLKKAPNCTSMERKKHNHASNENLLYLVIWLILFIAPVVNIHAHSAMLHEEIHFSRQEVQRIWGPHLFFLAIFLFHNILLAPILVYKHKRWLYATIMTLLFLCLAVFQCSHHFPTPPGVENEMMLPGPNPHEMQGNAAVVPIDMNDLVAFVIFVFMICANLGAKFYFKIRTEKDRIASLEKERLTQQIEYLRYQVNPHFFMNTLNNIHALIDIDPDTAKETLVELSRMMRYLLYEGDRARIPLQREIDFINNYVALMRLRYTDKVRIDLSLPHVSPRTEIAPMLIIPFIENAFKHGVSYKQPSFIEITIKVENGTILFTCKNSKVNTEQDEHGGVGLANVKKRLELLYPEKYSLNLQDDADIYVVNMKIATVEEGSVITPP